MVSPPITSCIPSQGGGGSADCRQPSTRSGNSHPRSNHQGNTSSCRPVHAVKAVAKVRSIAKEKRMETTLAQQLKKRNEEGRARVPAESLAVMDEMTVALAASGIANSSLGVGAKVPEFTLPNADGTMVSLSSLLAKGPMVIAFYRGGWCPYCSIELRALQNKLHLITAAGATLVAVSPQTPDNSLSTVEKLELAYPVLSDEGNQVAETFGLVFSLPEALREVYVKLGIDLPAANGDNTFRLPISATYVLRTDGTVAWRFADPDYTKRAEPDDVIAALTEL